MTEVLPMVISDSEMNETDRSENYEYRKGIKITILLLEPSQTIMENSYISPRAGHDVNWRSKWREAT